MMTSEAKIERILGHAEPVTESGCLIWLGAVDSCGYGRTFHNGKARKTTRVLWELKRGEIPTGLCVCHSCDVPACVNLDHLFLATHTDNMRDCMKKRRLTPCRGLVNGNAKLTEDNIRWARQKFTEKAMPIAEMARRLGVARSTVGLIVNGHRRTHVH